MHRPRLVGVPQQVWIRPTGADELAHLGRSPGVAVGVPGLLERIVPQIGGRKRQRIQELDLAVRDDQQHRLRAFEARLHLGQDVPRVNRQRDVGPGCGCALVQRADRLPPLRVAACDVVPSRRCPADAHQRPRHEGFAAERCREIVRGDDFAQVEPRGNENELRSETARREPRDRSGRRGKARSGTHPLVRRSGGAVDGNLHALDAKRCQPVRSGVIDAAAIGLELQCDAGVGQAGEEVPAMRRAERLAAAEGDIGDAGVDDARGDVQRLVARQLIAPRLVRSGFLAACDAAGAASIGQLPGEKKGRPVRVDRAPCHYGKFG